MIPVATKLELISFFKAPTLANGIITAYTVYCNTSATQAYSEQVIGPNEPTIRARAVVSQIGILSDMKTFWIPFEIGLNLYTQYDCYVTANTSAGEGPPSSIQSAVTSASGNLHFICKLCKSLNKSALN